MTTDKIERDVIRWDSVIFDLILLGFFLLITVLAFGYNPRAGSIPLGLGVLGSAMVLLQLMVDAVPRWRSALKFVSSRGILAGRKHYGAKGLDEPGKNAAADEHQKSKSGEWLQVLRIVLWLVGFILVVAYTHYLIAVGAFLILVTKLEAKESWKRSIILAVSVVLGFYILFDLLLQAQL
ncbi:MAG: tripartite tricarboxylate transporter TctB family protein [Pseudomonadota bacterium]